jgi:hypothetical protein
VNKHYLNLLKQLQSDIRVIETKRKKTRWKPHQKLMIDYINGATSKAIYEKDSQKIILAHGDEKKGFIHILLRHYKKNDLEAMDIVNIFEIYIRGIKLENEGVSNDHLVVYMRLSNQKELRLVLNPINNNSWVVTAYRKT